MQTAVDGLIEPFDLVVERSVEVADAGAERGFELQQALIEGGGDLAAVRDQAGVESVDVVLEAVADLLGARAHALDDLAAEGFDGTIELGDMARDQRAERAAVAGEFFRKFAALVLHQFVEGAHLQREAVVCVFGLADHLGDQCVHGHVECVAGLVAGGEDAARQAVAGFVDLVDEIARAQFEFEQERVGGILQGVVDLLGAVGDAVDDGRGALLEFAGDAVDAFVQHLVDAIGEIDELVVDVAGLEVEAGGQSLGGVEHGARGLGAGFFQAVEQVAAALAEREDHVVAGMTEGARDVLATLFQRAGDAFCDLVDARGDGVRDQRDVVAQINLDAGNGAANLLGLADQIVALMGDILQQGADPHFVVGIGALECCDFIRDERFQFSGARDRALDAVAHRGDFAANRLTDGHHRIGGGALGLGEADRDLRHRLRDHPHFLAAPGEAREEIEQQHRRKEQRGKAGEHQHAAALSDRRLQRGQEADGQKHAAEHPDAAEDGGERVDAAGGAALLDRLQNLSDGFAIIVGGATGAARLLDRIEHRPLGASARVKRHIGIGRRGRRTGLRGEFVAKRISIGVDGRIADVERFLNGGERDFSGIFDLLGIVRHVQSEPSKLLRTQPFLQKPPQARS